MEAQIPKVILSKNNNIDVSLYYRVIAIKPTSHWHRNRHVDHGTKQKI